MTGKQITIYILLLAYLFLAGMLTIYHAFNFTKYVHVKGDETFNYAFLLLLSSVVFEAIVWAITKSFDWKGIVLATIINFILSFVLGLIILTTTGVSGIPRHLIFTYGACYLAFFTVVLVLQVNRLKENRI